MLQILLLCLCISTHMHANTAAFVLLLLIQSFPLLLVHWLQFKMFSESAQLEVCLVKLGGREGEHIWQVCCPAAYNNSKAMAAVRLAYHRLLLLETLT